MFEIRIDKKKVDRTLAKLVRRVRRPSAFLRTWGAEVAKKARANARAKGGKNFWREVAQATRLREVTDEHAIVSSDHVAAAQKEHGGVIKPKKAKALTIPIADEAYGKTAGDFEGGGRDLFVIPGKSPETKGILGFSDGDQFHPLFVLRTKVTQKPDPFWPTPSEVSDLGVKHAAFWIEDELKRAVV